MMDRRATHMVEPFVRAGYDMDAQAILLCESDGTPEEVAHEIARMEAVFRDAGATRCQVSASEAERLKFWAGRKNAFPAAGRVSPDYYCMDGTIPRRHLARVLGAIEQMEDDFGLRCANVFHAGDGNLHPLILFDSNKPDEVERAEKFGAAILELCVQVGGTVTGEHGVGMEKINQMCVQFSREELDAFLAVKRAFDPPCLLNPEKSSPRWHVAPNTARCMCMGRAELSRSRPLLGRTPYGFRPVGVVRPGHDGARRPQAPVRHGRRQQIVLWQLPARHAAGWALPAGHDAVSRHRQLSPVRTRRHGARRHAVGRSGGRAGRPRSDAGLRAAAFRARRDGGRLRGGRLVRAAPYERGRLARFRAGRAAAGFRRTHAVLRRRGHEECGRLRRVAPAGRFARHLRRPPGGVAQGRAEAHAGSDAGAARHAGAGAVLFRAVARQAAAGVRDQLERRRRWRRGHVVRAPVRRAARAGQRAAADRRRRDGTGRGAGLVAFAARADPHLLRTRQAAVAAGPAADRRRARSRSDAAGVGRRPALALWQLRGGRAARARRQRAGTPRCSGRRACPCRRMACSIRWRQRWR